MNLSPENILLVGSLLLLISIVAGNTSGRFGVPTLILFLIVGRLAGSEGIGGIYFDNINIAQFIGYRTKLHFVFRRIGYKLASHKANRLAWHFTFYNWCMHY